MIVNRNASQHWLGDTWKRNLPGLALSDSEDCAWFDRFMILGLRSPPTHSRKTPPFHGGHRFASTVLVGIKVDSILGEARLVTTLAGVRRRLGTLINSRMRSTRSRI